MKGQITITIASVISGILFITGGLSAYFGTQLASANRFVKAEERISVAETRVNTMDGDIKEIKSDVKEILKRLK